MESITIEEVLKIREANIIDVREEYEFATGSLPGAKNIPLMGLVMNANSFLKKDQAYYIICQAGGRSMQACMALEEKGYNVIQIEGGINLYK